MSSCNTCCSVERMWPHPHLDAHAAASAGACLHPRRLQVFQDGMPDHYRCSLRHILSQQAQGRPAAPVLVQALGRFVAGRVLGMGPHCLWQSVSAEARAGTGLACSLTGEPSPDAILGFYNAVCSTGTAPNCPSVTISGPHVSPSQVTFSAGGALVRLSGGKRRNADGRQSMQSTSRPDVPDAFLRLHAQLQYHNNPQKISAAIQLC